MKIRIILILLIVPFFVTGQPEYSLDDLRQMALAANRNLKMAGENVRMAQELKKAAFTQFLPTISAAGNYTWNEKNLSMLEEDAFLPVGAKMADGSFGFTADQISNKWSMMEGKPVPLDASGKPFDPAKNPENILWKNYAILPKEAMEFDIHHIFAGGINFMQPLFLGGKIAELNRMAEATEKLAWAKEDKAMSDLLLEVDEAYWRVISLEEKVLLAREYRNLLLKLDSDITYMVDEGMATRADELKVRVKLNEAELSCTRAENGLILSGMALNQICGLTPEGKTILKEMEPLQISLTAIQATTEEAFLLRPEIRALVQFENLARSSEKLMVSRFLPNVVMSGNYLVSNPNLFNGFQKEFNGMFSLGVTAAVPLYHFGERRHMLKAAQASRQNATLALEEAKEKVGLQIMQQRFKIEESLKKLTATEKNREHAEENLRCANEGFKEGEITSTDLIMAQTAWLSARSESIDAAIDVRLCRLYLDRALGILNKTVQPAKEK